jgi:hypothetical protein
MNAQRSVWSPPPPRVQQKYATYFGGFFDHREWYEYGRSRIRLWWTDAEMNRLAYRELSIPTELVDLINDFPRGLAPPLASVTHDNIILFLRVLARRDGIRALYVVCDPERVLRYGLVPLQVPPPTHLAVSTTVTVDGGSWTWDGRYVWPLFYDLPGPPGAERNGADLFTCRLDTEQGLAEQPIRLFDGYIQIIEQGEEFAFVGYDFYDAGWLATDLQATNAIIANIIDFYRYPDTSTDILYDLLSDYTFESKYLPDGPVPLRISRVGASYPSVRLLGTFPVGPAWAVRFLPSLPPTEENGFLRIFVGEQAAVNIPIVLSASRPYYRTTSTGLPYDLVAATSRWHMYGITKLLRCSSNTATIVFRETKFPTEQDLLDVLVEYDLASGMAVKDLVVPSILPEWGMRHEGTILAVPHMTSSKGRLELP